MEKVLLYTCNQYHEDGNLVGTFTERDKLNYELYKLMEEGSIEIDKINSPHIGKSITALSIMELNQHFNLCFLEEVKMDKKEEIRKRAFEMVEDSTPAIRKSLDRLINSGGIDVEDWDNQPTNVIVMTLVIAAMEKQINQLYDNGFSYKMNMKKDVKNLRYFH